MLAIEPEPPEAEAKVAAETVVSVASWAAGRSRRDLVDGVSKTREVTIAPHSRDVKGHPTHTARGCAPLEIPRTAFRESVVVPRRRVLDIVPVISVAFEFRSCVRFASVSTSVPALLPGRLQHRGLKPKRGRF
jgi:hypothetical protein